LRRDRRRILGRILIWIGVLAWAPFAWLKFHRHADPEMLPFLAVHLSGVIPGALLIRWPWWGKTRKSVPGEARKGIRNSNDRREAK
jgi:hypothetical protein